ncbi:integrase arm-type DNA-binding domain-containing protein [Vibrio sp. 1974]|uniref:tyrosine-type recombinase/integrase n=1 Tax=Vibrio sp. 1974 TaxID=3074584 RepID=UPI002966894F|nr:integrase arm-type DNA-binding domain-containing protein [Vibrio sp. 1974]MDW3122115.1 integrase arm-type DNA-binding domain-containing protein [Vibrio sp. 1974]
MSTPLTVQQIKQQKTRKNDYYIWDSTRTRGTGQLGCKILRSGSKIFYFKYFFNGKVRFLKVGRFEPMTLAEAREVRNEYMALLEKDICPKAHLEEQERRKREQAQIEEETGTFGQLIDEFYAYLKRTRSGARLERSLQAHQKHIEAYIRGKIPDDKKVNEITKQELVHFIGKIVKTAPVQGDKVLSIVRRMFEIALDYDDDPMTCDSPIKFRLDTNPAARIKKQNQSKPRRRSLTLEELGVLFSDESAKYFDRRIFLLLKLAVFMGGQRPLELLLSKHTTYFAHKKKFFLDAEDVKTERPNLIAKGDTALEIIEEVEELRFISAMEIDKLFSANNKLGHIDPNDVAKQVREFCNLTGFKAFQPRDLRRSVKNIMLEHGVSRDHTNYIQNHSYGDVAETNYIIYAFYKEKKAALKLLEKLVNKAITKANQNHAELCHQESISVQSQQQEKGESNNLRLFG